MNLSDYLTDDGQALLLLCSSLGCGEGPEAPEPFKLSEWNQLARKIHASSLQCPSALQGHTVQDLSATLQIPEPEAERIARLLERAGQVTLLLESLMSRGIWAITRVDPFYPAHLRTTLKHQAPTVVFGAGEVRLLQRPGIAVVGSRNVDVAAAAFARETGRQTAAAKWPVISGGARGTDRLAMDGGLQAEGVVVGVLADSLEKTIRQTDVRQFILDEHLVMLTPYGPDAGFSVGAAMGRNKVIYGLSAFAVVAASDFEKGGTWAGAVDAIKGNWCPVFVREAQGVPKGNRELVKLGAYPMTDEQLAAAENLPEWLRTQAVPRPKEQDLFG